MTLREFLVKSNIVVSTPDGLLFSRNHNYLNYELGIDMKIDESTISAKIQEFTVKTDWQTIIFEVTK